MDLQVLTNDYLQIFFGSLLISIAILYAWWSKLRVVFFRQDLFEIRNELWDRARRIDAFNDPLYIDARRTLNDTIVAASYISAPQMLRARLSGHVGKEQVSTDREDVKEIVKTADLKLVKRISRHILFDRPFTGIILFCLVTVLLAPNGTLKRAVGLWVNTNSPRELSAVAQRNSKAAHA